MYSNSSSRVLTVASASIGEAAEDRASVQIRATGTTRTRECRPRKPSTACRRASWDHPKCHPLDHHRQSATASTVAAVVDPLVLVTALAEEVALVVTTIVAVIVVICRLRQLAEEFSSRIRRVSSSSQHSNSSNHRLHLDPWWLMWREVGEGSSLRHPRSLFLISDLVFHCCLSSIMSIIDSSSSSKTSVVHLPVKSFELEPKTTTTPVIYRLARSNNNNSSSSSRVWRL